MLSKKLATVCIAVPIGFKPDKLFVISDLAQVNNSDNTCRNVLNLLLNSKENFQGLNTLHNSETTNIDLRDALCKLEKKKNRVRTNAAANGCWVVHSGVPSNFRSKESDRKEVKRLE